MHYVHFYLGYIKVCNHSQPPATIQNHPQPLATAQKLHKKAKTYHKQLCYCTLDVINIEIDIGFNSDMKQCYMCMHVCLVVYILYKSLYLLVFG